MRLIKEMLRTILKLLFHMDIDSPTEDLLKNEEKESWKRLLDMIHRGNINEAENLVFSAHGANVCMNMARGKVIYRNGAFLTLDLDRIKAEVRQYALPLIFQ